MTDKEPTKEQIRKFWAWCGFYEHDHMGGTDIDREEYQIDVYTPDGKLVSKYPKLDLNNLFKYAVPKLHTILGYEGLYDFLVIWVRDIVFGKPPALTLCLAIEKFLDRQTQIGNAQGKPTLQSRSVQRRIAAQKGLPAPDFSGG